MTTGDANDRARFDRLLGPNGRPQTTLSADEAADWASAIADVAPLDKDHASPALPPRLRIDPSRARFDGPPPEDAKAPPLARGLERSIEKRIRRGDVAIDGRIDLHGMTAERARTALTRFLRMKQAEGARCALVITGKGQRVGSGGAPGVIRTALPEWLAADDLRPLVFAHRPSHAKHGGDGASYVFLRKSGRNAS
ncbi:MAG: Smr/MutS family protein [Pseudomonadota bacterium]